MTQLNKNNYPSHNDINSSIDKFRVFDSSLSEEELKQKGICDAFLRKIDPKLPLFDYTEKVVVISNKGYELLAGLYLNSPARFPALIKFKLIEDNPSENVFNITFEDYPEDNNTLVSLV